MRKINVKNVMMDITSRKYNVVRMDIISIFKHKLVKLINILTVSNRQIISVSNAKLKITLILYLFILAMINVVQREVILIKNLLNVLKRNFTIVYNIKMNKIVSLVQMASINMELIVVHLIHFGTP